MSVKVGVIGVGYLGQHHARIFSELEGVELVGVSDNDIRRANEISGAYGCRAFERYSDMVEQTDAVSIVTPTTTHYAIACECLGAGKDVFIEKPITENLEEARGLVADAENRGLIMQVGHLERYNPAILAAEEMLDEPRFLEAERLSPFLGRGTDVDVTLDLMIHDIDVLLGIVKSAVTDIRATGETVMTGRIDVAKAWLEFENGCKALVTASRLSKEKKRKLKIFQRDSYLSVDYQTQEVGRYCKHGSEISYTVIRPGQKEPLREELRDFVHNVVTREKPRVSGKEAAAALEIVLGITAVIKSATV
jgi:predicted dehydrogenase